MIFSPYSAKDKNQGFTHERQSPALIRHFYDSSSKTALPLPLSVDRILFLATAMASGQSFQGIVTFSPPQHDN